MTDQETFTTRLRRQRQRARISLSDIAAATRVKEELPAALERNDLSAWPRGLYACACVRVYATAIGLNADSVIEDFCRLFPQGDRRVQLTMKEIAASVASESEWKDEFSHAEGERRRSVRQRPRKVQEIAVQLTDMFRAWRIWVPELAAMSTRLIGLVPKAQSRKPKAEHM